VNIQQGIAGPWLLDESFVHGLLMPVRAADRLLARRLAQLHSHLPGYELEDVQQALASACGLRPDTLLAGVPNLPYAATSFGLFADASAYVPEQPELGATTTFVWPIAIDFLKHQHEYGSPSTEARRWFLEQCVEALSSRLALPAAQAREALLMAWMQDPDLGLPTCTSARPRLPASDWICFQGDTFVTGPRYDRFVQREIDPLFDEAMSGSLDERRRAFYRLLQTLREQPFVLCTWLRAAYGVLPEDHPFVGSPLADDLIRAGVEHAEALLPRRFRGSIDSFGHHESGTYLGLLREQLLAALRQPGRYRLAKALCMKLMHRDSADSQEVSTAAPVIHALGLQHLTARVVTARAIVLAKGGARGRFTVGLSMLMLRETGGLEHLVHGAMGCPFLGSMVSDRLSSNDGVLPDTVVSSPDPQGTEVAATLRAIQDDAPLRRWLRTIFDDSPFLADEYRLRVLALNARLSACPWHQWHQAVAEVSTKQSAALLSRYPLPAR
jgi:hypothetical protein